MFILSTPIFHCIPRYWNDEALGNIGVGLAEEHCIGEGEFEFQIDTKGFRGVTYKVDKAKIREFVKEDPEKRVQIIKSRKIGIIPFSMVFNGMEDTYEE